VAFDVGEVAADVEARAISKQGADPAGAPGGRRVGLAGERGGEQGTC
jgi:hypothetical protein